MHALWWFESLALPHCLRCVASSMGGAGRDVARQRRRACRWLWRHCRHAWLLTWASAPWCASLGVSEEALADGSPWRWWLGWWSAPASLLRCLFHGALSARMRRVTEVRTGGYRAVATQVSAIA